MSTDPDSVGVGELSRQVRDVFLRFEGLATKLDVSFVTKELYNMRQIVIDKDLATLDRDKAEKSALEEVRRRVDSLELGRATKGETDELCKRIDSLEDDKKWLIRLVLSFIILGILGAIFVTSGVSIK